MHVRTQTHNSDLKRFALQLAVLTALIAVLIYVGYQTVTSVAVQKDVIYGRKLGTALTMDVYRPFINNGAGIIWVVSGGWYSDHNAVDQTVLKPLFDKGYT